MMGPANLRASATTDQIQKATEKMATDLAKPSADKCGDDPRPYTAAEARLLMQQGDNLMKPLRELQ